MFGIIKMKQIMKFAKIATSVALALQSVSEIEAIQVKKFDFSLWGKADLDELKNKDFGRYVAVKLFKDSFRLHYDELRIINTMMNNTKSGLLNDNSGKYFLTLNEVIPREIAKAMFDIEIEGDSVNYVNEDPYQIIECSTINYKSLKEYDDANWNYLLLVNVIHRIMNSQNLAWDIQNVPFIKETAERMEKHFGVEYKGKINNSRNDIEQYFQQLNLYQFLGKCYYCPETLQDACAQLQERQNRFKNVANTPLMKTPAVMNDMMQSNWEWYSNYSQLKREDRDKKYKTPRVLPYKFAKLLNTENITGTRPATWSDEINYQMKRGSVPIAIYTMDTSLKKFNKYENTLFKNEYTNFISGYNKVQTIKLGQEELNKKELLFIKHLENLEATYKIFERSEQGIIHKILKEAETQRLTTDKQLLLEMFNIYLYLTQLMPSEYESIYLNLIPQDVRRMKEKMNNIMKEIAGRRLNEMTQNEIEKAFSVITKIYTR